MPSKKMPPQRLEDSAGYQNPGFCGACGSMSGYLAVLLHRDGKPISLCIHCWRKGYQPMSRTAVRRLVV